MAATRYLLTSGLLALALALNPAAAALYKWTDKDGQVHYSDHPAPPEARQPPPEPDTATSSSTGQREATDGTPRAAYRAYMEAARTADRVEPLMAYLSQQARADTRSKLQSTGPKMQRLLLRLLTGMAGQISADQLAEEVSGDTATLTGRQGDMTLTVDMRREGGEWKIHKQRIHQETAR